MWSSGFFALVGLLVGMTACSALAQSPDALPLRPLPHTSARAAILYGDGVGISPGRWSAAPVETGRLRLALKERPADRWLGFDKAQHAAFSFLWTLSSQYTLVNKIDVSEGRALPVAVGSSAFFGLAKEVYDWRLGPYRHFSYRDLVADAFGVALAAGLILL